MTFADYVKQVTDTVFPEGRAENLIPRQKLVVLDALIDLQRKIKCLREQQCSFYTPAQAFDVCTASVVPNVSGAIKTVYVAKADSVCDFILLGFLPPEEFDVLVRDNNACVAEELAALDAATDPPPDPRKSMPCETPVIVRPVLSARQRCGGYFTFDVDSIRVWPPLCEDEVLVVQWSGIKRAWDDFEEMAQIFAERDVMRGAELYLEGDTQRFEAKDLKNASAALGLYGTHVADLIYTCRHNRFPVPGLQLPRSLMPPGSTGPSPITAMVYYGKSPNAGSYTEGEIVTWTAVPKSNRFGNYSFPAGPGYCCFAFPAIFGAPADLGQGEGFHVGELPAAMGRPDGVPPYGVWDSGYGVEKPAVFGVMHRVYRTYYLPNGEVIIRVS